MDDLQASTLERITRSAADLSRALADVNGPYDRDVIARAVLVGLSSPGLSFAPDESKRSGVAQALAELGREARAALGDAGLDGELEDERLDAAIWQFLEFTDDRDWTAFELAEALARNEIPVWCHVPRAEERLAALEHRGRALRVGQRDGETTWKVAQRFHDDP
jgi:hypothetical protein